jgi:23S rRNA pseudouridine1911/1915/1917 synthase
LSSDAIAEAIEKAAFRVESGEAGMRLDAFLAAREPRFSRSRIKALIQAGGTRLGGREVDDAAHRLDEGDLVELLVPPVAEPTPEPEVIPLSVVFEDDDVVVIDKPASLVVHPGAGNLSGTLVNALIAHCGASLSGIGGVRRPGIVHRLDKDTSGLLVVAKNDAAHRGLAAQFADHGRSGPLAREYEALVWGVPNPHIGRVDLPLNRDIRNRRKQAVARSGGRNAVTRYAVEERFGPIASLLACRLETGRTHQIRVHLAHIGHPLVGDAVYGSGFLTKAAKLPRELGERVRAFPRQALHARRLRFSHPRTGEILEFEANRPADMADLVERFRKAAL